MKINKTGFDVSWKILRNFMIGEFDLILVHY